MVLEKDEIETDTAQLLEQLNIFFCGKNSGEFALTYQMMNEILQSSNCDKRNLLEIMKLINKNGYVNYNDKNNVYQVSSDSQTQNKIYVKGFSSGTKSNLYFFGENQKNPYLKIKSSLSDGKFSIRTELAKGGVSFSNHGQKKIKENEPFLFMTSDFSQFDDKKSTKKIMNLHSSDNLKNIADETLYDEDFLRFYSVFVKSRYRDSSKVQPSRESNQILKNCIVEPVKAISNFDYEMDFNELMKIADYVICGNAIDGENNGEEPNLKNISSFICKPSELGDDQQSIFSINLDENKKGTVKTQFYPNFCSIEIKDENKKDICFYLICKTTDGFTICRTVRGENFCQDKNNITHYTLNFCESEGKIRFSGLHNDMAHSRETFPLEIVLELNEDGSVNLDSKSIFQSNNGLNKNSSSKGQMS